MSIRSRIYLVLTVVGFAIPNLLLLRFVAENGWYLDIDAVKSILIGNKLVFAFVADLILSCLVYFYWMFREARKHDIKTPWAFVLFTLFFGLSFSLPLFLFVRQKRRDALIPKA